MENSPWLHPAFLVSAAVALIGLVAWFIRLESKTNANNVEIQRIQAEINQKSEESKHHRERIEDDLYKHLMDEKRHYNEQFFNEFRNTLERRFQQIDNQLSGISGKLDKLSK